jgi:hypothetical protein
MTHSIHETIAVAISGAPFPTARSLGKARAVLSALSAAGLAVVPREATAEQSVEGMAVVIRDGGDLRAAYQAAIEKAEAGDGSH